MWLVCAGAGKMQRVAQVPLVSCLEDLSQGHVLHTLPCRGKEFKGKGGKKGKSYVPADFLVSQSDKVCKLKAH